MSLEKNARAVFGSTHTQSQGRRNAVSLHPRHHGVILEVKRERVRKLSLIPAFWICGFDRSIDRASVGITRRCSDVLSHDTWSIHDLALSVTFS